jgi:hypothetical protein
MIWRLLDIYIADAVLFLKCSWFHVLLACTYESLLTHSRVAPLIEFTIYSHTMITIITAESPVLFATVQLDMKARSPANPIRSKATTKIKQKRPATNNKPINHMPP